MIHYLWLFFGVIIGQALWTSVNVYRYQIGKHIDWGQAMKEYWKASKGLYIIGGTGLLALLFILSEFVNLDANRQEMLTGDLADWKKKVITYFKTCSVFLGMFIQVIIFKFEKRGKEAIDNAVPTKTD